MLATLTRRHIRGRVIMVNAMKSLRGSISGIKGVCLYSLKRQFERIEIQDLPHVDADTLGELRERMARSRSYLEYGSGGSTVLASTLVKGDIVSVESDRKFARAVRDKTRDASNVTVLHANIGPTGPWGRPMLNLPTRWRTYPELPWNYQTSVPDLIFVDGRFRVACVLYSLLQLPSNWTGTFILDDYEKRRDGYSAIEEFIASPEAIGRSLSFTIGRFDRTHCADRLTEHLADWR